MCHVYSITVQCSVVLQCKVGVLTLTLTHLPITPQLALEKISKLTKDGKPK